MFAVEKVRQRMLEEAQRLECVIEDNQKEVTDWSSLREFYCKGIDNDVIAMYDIAIGVFELSPGWMKDTETELLDKMGWVYDPATMKKGKNNIGNGAVEKVISRAKTDLRGRLRQCCFTGRSKFTLPIKRPKEETFVNGRYCRRVRGVPHYAIPTSVVPAAAVVPPVIAPTVPATLPADVVVPPPAAASVPPTADAATTKVRTLSLLIVIVLYTNKEYILLYRQRLPRIWLKGGWRVRWRD
jgi:hypothetical protein